MFTLEQKIIDFIRKNIICCFLVIATLLGILMRWSGILLQSGDYTMYLSKWWNEISVSGLSSLKNQIGDYNIPYQIMIALLTYLPFGPLISYKLLSIIFDFVLAISSAVLVYELSERKSKIKMCFTYTIVFCSINIVFNSSFWAQCDSIYCSFILLGIYFLIKNRNVLSFIMFGIAFAFKLQTVFILPFLMLYYFTAKKYSILHFLIIPVVDVIMCLPAILFFGRPFGDIFGIYIYQTGKYKVTQINFPNLYAILSDSARNFSELRFFAIALALFMLVGMFVFLIISNFDLSNKENFFIILAWSLWTVVMFMPSMHDRYAYLLDLILIVISIIFHRKKYWIFAFVCNMVSLRSACYFLFLYDFLDIKITALFYIVFYLIFSIYVIKDVICDKTEKFSYLEIL